MRPLRGLVLFGSAVWCGALGSFAAAAGLVLRASPSRHAGGTVNRSLLDALDVSSYAFALLLGFGVLALARAEGWSKVTRGLALRLALFCGAAAFVSHVIITPEMMSLRDRMPSIVDLVPKSDPMRKEWGRLHGLSSFALLVRLLGSAGLFVLVFRAEPAPTGPLPPPTPA